MVICHVNRSFIFVLSLLGGALFLFSEPALAQSDQQTEQREGMSPDIGEGAPPVSPEEEDADPLSDLLRNNTIDDQDGSIFSPRLKSDPSGVETIEAIEAPGRQSESPDTENTTVEISDRQATLRALEKVTARIQDLDIGLGETVKFKSLEITLRTCNKRPPEETPETTAFLEIVDNKPDGEAVSVFTGWMFASSPALNALEHPVYDVWVIDCKITDPGA